MRAGWHGGAKRTKTKGDKNRRDPWLLSLLTKPKLTVLLRFSGFRLDAGLFCRRRIESKQRFPGPFGDFVQIVNAMVFETNKQRGGGFLGAQLLKRLNARPAHAHVRILDVLADQRNGRL